MKDLLKKLDACESAIKWAGDKTWPEIYTTCERGDWLLWLFEKTDGDKILAAKAAVKCIEPVKDVLGHKVVQAYADYSKGRISFEELLKIDTLPNMIVFGAAVMAPLKTGIPRETYLKQAAEIVRSIIPIEKFNL